VNDRLVEVVDFATDVVKMELMGFSWSERIQSRLEESRLRRRSEWLPPAATVSSSSVTSTNFAPRLCTSSFTAGRISKASTTAPRRRLVAIACGQPPTGRAKWTMRLLADTLVELEIVDSVSHTTVWETLKKTNLNPICGNAG
jgi:hypothetical protein